MTMTTHMRRRIKNLVEGVTGYDIERVGNRSLGLIAQQDRADAWFSHNAQLRSLFLELRIDLVIDVGANEGHFAQSLRAFYTGEIHSFEPVSSIFARLETAASRDPHWHVHNFALGSRETRQSINISNLTVFSSFLKSNDFSKTHFGDEVLDMGCETVAVRRFDNVIGQIAPNSAGRRIFVKVDTQGYDTEVFHGIGDELRNISALQSEVSLIPIYEGMPHWTESIALYERYGFGVVGMFPVTRDSMRVIEYDCLLRKAAT